MNRYSSLRSQVLLSNFGLSYLSSEESFSIRDFPIHPEHTMSAPALRFSSVIVYIKSVGRSIITKMSLTFMVAIAACLIAVLSHSLSSNTSSLCSPGNSCWPTTAQWTAFNSSVGGNLYSTVPLGSSCFPTSAEYNNVSCANVKMNFMNGSFRESVYGAMQYTQWETCGTASCVPSLQGPETSQCSLGRLSPFYVRAQEPAHISATLQFAQAHQLQISIKNTGHDYLGRSAAPNSLAIWTADLKNMSYQANFTAYNCNCPSSNSQNIGIVGAGVVGSEAAAFFDRYGMASPAGQCPSVGLAGGYGQGGGHSIYGPSYGLMVDQAGKLLLTLPHALPLKNPPF